ncbi:unnamed protein product [Alopecurus aequalis]
MAPAGPWSDLPSELLESIANADSVSLRDYASLRGVCTAWRSALEPPSYPCLLSLADDKGSYSASVFSLTMRRPFHLHTVSSTLISEPMFRSRARVVGSSNGRFAVAVDHSSPSGELKTAFLNCWTKKIFLLDPRAGKEVELAAPTGTLNSKSSPCHEYVHKVVFPPGPDDGTVVALYDRKYIACIDVATSRDKWKTIYVGASNTEYLADVTFGDDGKLYCLDSNGSLYQVWRNNRVTVTAGGFTMPVDEILVLRYNPGCWPCWDAVKDLGGCSVFVDKSNSSAVVRAAGVPGVRADCVYWINWMRVPMVCDIATGTSKPYVLPYGTHKGGNCWYFSHDDMTGINGDQRN